MIKLLLLFWSIASEIVCRPRILAENLVNAWENSGQFEGDIMRRKGDSISFRHMMRQSRWPGGIVPYVVNNVFDHNALQAINTAMRTLEDVIAQRGINEESCQLRFVPRDEHHRDFIYISDHGKGICWSILGHLGGPQEVSLGNGCRHVGTIMHELMHALGFQHQHSAHNRDDYINVNFENVEESHKHDFNKTNKDYYTSFGLPYDFKSIMHYSPYAFSIRDKRGYLVGPTLTPKDPSIKLVRNKKLSELDKIKLQLMYCRKYTIPPRDE